ncbi:hypothetical protein CsSME_00036519 [Camellia sinensis var. sinensis]
MDVTFFESRPYFPSSPVSPSSLQGDKEIPVPLPPVVDHIEDDEPTVVEEKAGKVYIRDKDRQQVTWMQETTFLPLLPTSSPDECPESPGNSDSSTPILDFSYLNVPITNRKGMRSCTQHLITNHVSYSNLSSSYKAFLSKAEF